LAEGPPITMARVEVRPTWRIPRQHEWNISPAKEGSSRKKEKKRRREQKEEREMEQGLKSKSGESSYEEAPCLKRIKEKRMKFTSCWERSIKRKKERRSHFPIVQNPMCGLIHTHTSFAFALPSIP
jgi:hypothetical protein